MWTNTIASFNVFTTKQMTKLLGRIGEIASLKLFLRRGHFPNRALIVVEHRRVGRAT